ncbi:senescence-associated carboxylesterase 101-like [Rhodamnia argentea]|uniref:Senescence-associated carboxylesterase 101-like n=1 Tax=Rhodamnia argentea TaxID=178133 RepID=A0A8B8R4L8_9MYRT|nr:senescence-associated carboxylesterase 101-like [Rhodamnia argentea]
MIVGHQPPLSLFSHGLDLANLAVASGVLGRSWDAVSQLQGQLDDKKRHPSSPSSSSVAFKEFRHPEFTIIAFDASPVGASCLQEQSDLVPWLEIPRFHFLCSEDVPSFSVNRAAISLFDSLCDEHGLSVMRAEIAESAKSTPYIITGHGVAGCVASLFTLWLLDALDASTTMRPLCITFGSPLLGDDGFRQAISQFSPWNSCFLHVVHKEDRFPSLWLQPDGEPSLYVPFGAFLLCSDSRGACFGAPESVTELLASRSSTENGRNQELPGFHYGSIIERLEGRSIRKDQISLARDEPDSFRAGIVAQVTAIALTQVQIESVLKSEEESATRIRAAARSDASSKASDMERRRYMINLEWYKKMAASDGFGYYDSYKSKPKKRDHHVITYKETLKEYWQGVVKESEKKPHGEWLRSGRLFGGNTYYRRMVEPLNIAEYYAKGKRDYLTQGRSRHYILLEKWLEENLQRAASLNPVNSRGKGSRPTF